MKNISPRLVGVLALACGIFAITFSAEAGTRGGPRKPPPKIPYTAIVSVDTTAMTITVAPKNSNATGSKTYKFTPKTTITVKGHAGTAADLVPGMQIHVGAGMDETIAEELSVTDAPVDPVAPTPRPRL